MNNIDNSIDDMENTRFSKLYKDIIRRKSQPPSIFTHTELTCIFMVYHKFVIANGPKARKMTKNQFQRLFVVLFDIHDAFIVSRIISTLEATADKYITKESWLDLMTIFFTDDLEMRMKFVFNVYNVDGNGVLNREFVTQCVEKFFNGDDEDEVTELRSDMVEFLFSKFDEDKDNCISITEYCEIVRLQPTLMEFLGQVLPRPSTCSLIAYCFNLLTTLRSRFLNF